MTQRDAYWDLLRCVAIVAVVWIHATPGPAFADSGFDYWVVLRNAINFPVALFFFISGYMVNPLKVTSLTADGSGVRTPLLDDMWLRTRVVRLVLPFIVWSSAYFALAVLRNDSIGNLIGVLPRVALGRGAPHLYFVVVLLQLTVLTPIFIRLVRGKKTWMVYGTTPLYLILVYVFAYARGELPPM